MIVDPRARSEAYLSIRFGVMAHKIRLSQQNNISNILHAK